MERGKKERNFQIMWAIYLLLFSEYSQLVRRAWHLTRN
jgi:hypothetical protein